MSTIFQIPPERPTAKPRFRRPAALGITALVCGILSVLGVVVQSLWGPFTPSVSFTEQVMDRVTHVAGVVVSSVTGAAHVEPPPMNTLNVDQVIRQIIVLLSVVGMLTGVLAYVRRENMRVVGSALIISGVAFATQSLLFPLLVIGAVAVLVLLTTAF